MLHALTLPRPRRGDRRHRPPRRRLAPACRRTAGVAPVTATAVVWARSAPGRGRGRAWAAARRGRARGTAPGRAKEGRWAGRDAARTRLCTPPRSRAGPPHRASDAAFGGPADAQHTTRPVVAQRVRWRALAASLPQTTLAGR